MVAKKNGALLRPFSRDGEHSRLLYASRRYSRWVLIAAVVVSLEPAAGLAAEYVSPAELRLKADVSFLADDARAGRGTGSEGIAAAADYIAAIFRETGLKTAPGADGYFQHFTVRGDLQVAQPTSLAFHLPNDTSFEASLGSEFTPLALGGGGTVERLPVVFAGYGITAKDTKLKFEYDDYQDVDVTGKAVLILRGAPQLEKKDSAFAGKKNASYESFAHKRSNAKAHGAAVALLVNDSAGLKGAKDSLLQFPDAGVSGSGMPFLMTTRALADRLLAAAKQPLLEELERQMDADLKPVSRPLEGCTLDAKVTMERGTLEAKNIIGVLDGAGPLSDQTVVIGAHYDHLGRSGFGSLAPGGNEIHNGADDNASGTAMVLEMARRLARRSDPLPRRVVFIAFSGEERGLLGSRYYVKHPLNPLAGTTFMINFDMVGRLNDRSELTIFGAGTSPGLDDLTKALASSQGLVPKLSPGTQGAFFASDHASFYSKDIPVVFAYTGGHADYHRPTDDVEKINFRGMARVADFAELLVLDVTRRPERPKFVKLPDSRLGAPRLARGNEAYLGTRQSYDGNLKGVKLEFVAEGGPAEKGRLKVGDTIVKFDGKPVESLDDFMAGVEKHKSGDGVEIVVQRDGQQMSLRVTLGSRSSD
jgi:hypothetical protein